MDLGLYAHYDPHRRQRHRYDGHEVTLCRKLSNYPPILPT